LKEQKKYPTIDPDITLNQDAPAPSAPALAVERESVSSCVPGVSALVCPICGKGFDDCYCAAKSLSKWLAVSALCFILVLLAHVLVRSSDSETRIVLISLVFGLAAGPAMASLMYFRFRMRLRGWQMKTAAVLIFCAVWTSMFFAMVFPVLELVDILPSADKWMLTWMFPTGEVILAVVLSYVGAFLGTYSLIFVDKCRSTFLGFLEDHPPIQSSLSVWANRVSPWSLILLPILLFTITTVVANRAGAFLVHSKVQINRVAACPECPALTSSHLVNYELIHPFYFQSNRADVIRLSVTGIERSQTPSCTLDAPSFEVRPIPLDSAEKEFRSNGEIQSVPTCLWVVMPRHSGDQKAVFRLSFPPVKMQDTDPPGNRDLQGNLVDVVILHVSSGLFTFSNLGMLLGLIAVAIGVARIIGRRRSEEGS